MNIQEARKILWLKNNRRPLGELLDEGFLTQSRLEWAAEKAYDPELKQAAKIILEWLKRPNSEHSATTEPVQQQVSAMSVGISLEKARVTTWPFAPYKGKSMGELVESKQISLKDLGYAIENAYDEKVRQAAIVLSLVRLEQVVKEPAPSAGFVQVISGGRSYAERKQLQLALLEGAIAGAFLGIMLVLTVLSFSKPQQQGKTISDIVSTPMDVIVIIVVLTIGASFKWADFERFSHLNAQNGHDSCRFAPHCDCSCFSKKANLLKVGRGERFFLGFGVQVGEKTRKN